MGCCRSAAIKAAPNYTSPDADDRVYDASGIPATSNAADVKNNETSDVERRNAGLLAAEPVPVRQSITKEEHPKTHEVPLAANVTRAQSIRNTFHIHAQPPDPKGHYPGTTYKICNLR